MKTLSDIGLRIKEEFNPFETDLSKYKQEIKTFKADHSIVYEYLYYDKKNRLRFCIYTYSNFLSRNWKTWASYNKKGDVLIQGDLLQTIRYSYDYKSHKVYYHYESGETCVRTYDKLGNPISYEDSDTKIWFLKEGQLELNNDVYTLNGKKVEIDFANKIKNK